MINKVIDYKNLNNFLGKIKTKNKVLVGGCFDILHLGHIRFLENAKKIGQVLIVLLESDEKIAKIKGKNRPFNSQDVRAEILSAFSFVDYILLLPDNKNFDYQKLVEKIKPNVIAVSSNDPKLKVKKEMGKRVGAKLMVVQSFLEEFSTTNILKMIKYYRINK